MADNNNPMNNLNNFNNTPDSTGQYSQQDIESNKVMAILSYFTLLVLVPIFAAKESPYARFHANQGLVLLIIEAILYVITYVLGWIPVIGWILALVVWVLEIIVLVLAIMGIVNAAQGKAKELPIVGGIKILK